MHVDLSLISIRLKCICNGGPFWTIFGPFWGDDDDDEDDDEDDDDDDDEDEDDDDG